ADPRGTGVRAGWCAPGGGRPAVYAAAPPARRRMPRSASSSPPPAGGPPPPILHMHELKPGVPVSVAGAGGPIEALPFRQEHGDIPSLGFRIGDVAYSSDLHDMPADSAAALRGLGLSIVAAPPYTPHPSTLTIAGPPLRG